MLAAFGDRTGLVLPQRSQYPTLWPLVDRRCPGPANRGIYSGPCRRGNIANWNWHAYLLATLSIFLKPARPLPREQWLTGGVGFISGILGGASSISGPVVVLFGLNQGWHPRGMRADLLHYFLGSYLVALLMFRKVGVLDVQAVQLGSVAIPGIVAGYFAGTRLKDYLSPLFFRRLALSAITISGLAALLADWW